MLKFQRRQFLSLAAGAAAMPTVSRMATAQTYPTRPVRIVVGFTVGGFYDTYARLIAQWLSEHLGQPFIIENRIGAGGSIATEAVVRAAPDGYTLLFTGSNDAWNTALYDNLSFNYVRDIAPVASISKGMGVLVVPPSFPARTVHEFIAYARDNPAKVTIASDGVGSGPHVFWELFRSMTGLNTAARALSRRGTRYHRSPQCTGAGLFRLCGAINRVHQEGPAAPASGDECNTRGSVARRSDHR